jgi:hypothetical protein
MNYSEKVDSLPAQARPARARKSARSWGDINLTLNRLVREGVISAFKTNLSSPDRISGISVMITPDPSGDVEEIKARVSSDLEALIDDVTVTIGEPQAA